MAAGGGKELTHWESVWATEAGRGEAANEEERGRLRRAKRRIRRALSSREDEAAQRLP